MSNLSQWYFNREHDSQGKTRGPQALSWSLKGGFIWKENEGNGAVQVENTPWVLHVSVSLLSPITLQALVQCGQPQCYTHILQWLKSEGGNPLLIDIATYLLALIPDPSEHRLQEIFNTTKEQQSRATFYALSRVVNR